MQRGDTVVCVDNLGMEHRLTLGVKYTVMQATGMYVSVVDDTNQLYTFSNLRFQKG